jgi:hypothetical protein
MKALVARQDIIDMFSENITSHLKGKFVVTKFPRNFCFLRNPSVWMTAHSHRR